jgi:preprotein translocase subunit SecY
MFTVSMFWVTGAMFVLWLGEQISEKGIGNGVSLMIFIGIISSLPFQIQLIATQVVEGFVQYWQVFILILLFVAMTWFVVMFTIAQRRIPIQHTRRMMGNKMVSNSGPNYLPLPMNLVGVIPIIFAVSLIYMPASFALIFQNVPQIANALNTIGEYMNPASPWPKGLGGATIYTLLIFFFTYWYTAIQFNVEDMAENLKRSSSYIPGVRPGKQTVDFLNGVISRLTIVSAAFLSFIALSVYLAPLLTQINTGLASLLLGTSLLIIVQVALETMRQIEANLMMKQYGS